MLDEYTYADKDIPMDNREMHDLSDTDIDRSARVIISEYGGAAMEKAAERLQKYIAEKNGAAVEAWAKIYRTIATYSRY